MPARIDRTGRRYGHLLVLGPADRRDGSSIVWRCRCDCGAEIEVSGRHLGRPTVSCGCQRREAAAVNLAGDPADKLGQVERTNLSRLRSDAPQKNNRSGYRGVSWHKNPHGSGRWVAVIYFQRRRYRLGFFDTPEEASKAYQAAKDHIHLDFITWYEQRLQRERG